MTKEQKIRYIGLVTSLVALAVVAEGHEEAARCVGCAALMGVRLNGIDNIRIYSSLAVIYS